MSRITTYLTGLLLLYTVEAALSQSICLQQLQLDDPVLTKRLTSFIQLTKARWLFVHVQADFIDHSYTFYIRPIEEYEPVREYRGYFWGEWQHAMLFFYMPTYIPAIGRVVSIADLANLRMYARLCLPRIHTPVPGQRGYFKIHFRNTSSAFNEFKVVNGREVYFCNTSKKGYIDEPLVPDSLPPVPEHK
jgi:hypothetical protein